jgi:hypothetical protein
MFQRGMVPIFGVEGHAKQETSMKKTTNAANIKMKVSLESFYLASLETVITRNAKLDNLHPFTFKSKNNRVKGCKLKKTGSSMQT